MEYYEEELTKEIIAAAIEVHKYLGPGLLEPAYEACLFHELTLRGLAFKKQVSLPLEYKGFKLDCGYRIDLLIEDKIVIELKTVDKVLPIHQAQLLTCLKLQKCKVGLVVNCPEARLKDGICRLVH